MEARPAFTLSIQGPYEPRVTAINELRADRFVAVRLAAAGEAEAEVFITSREEADQFIQAFTDAKALLPDEDGKEES